MPAQIIQMMAFTQIVAILTPRITLQDHLKVTHKSATCDFVYFIIEAHKGLMKERGEWLDIRREQAE